MWPRSSGLLNTLHAVPLLCIIITTDVITILLPTVGKEETCTRAVVGAGFYSLLYLLFAHDTDRNL